MNVLENSDVDVQMAQVIQVFQVKTCRKQAFISVSASGTRFSSSE